MSQALRIERTFDAPVDAVWAAWTDPKQYAHWFNPSGIPLVIREFDLRPGGRIDFDMPQPDGSPHPQTGVFHVVDPKRELVSGSPDKSFLLRVTFEPVGARTRLVMETTGIPPEFHRMAAEGWSRGLAQLASLVEREPEEALTLTLSRTFDAPPERVWRAWTDPKEVDPWWGPNGFRNETSAMDLHPFGEWRFVMHGPDGTDYANLVRYLEVRPTERLVYDHGSPDEPEQFRVVVRFEDEGGKTRVTMRSIFPTAEGIERVKSFGAEELGKQTLARLAEHLGR